jgi:predicted NAD/FAD-binding protein
MVFNRRTYPNLLRFFEHLGVDWWDNDMAFSVQVPNENIEWAGHNLNSVFAQRKNLLNPKFLRMIADILKLSRDADRLLDDPSVDELTLGQLLEREGFSAGFTDWYLIPMGDAIWSTPPGDMLDYPAGTYLRFCNNHGLLTVSGKPQWLSLVGGARGYVDEAAKAFSGEVYLGEPVERIDRDSTGVTVTTAARSQRYDAVVVATHPPQSLEMLGEGATDEEREVLGAFKYWPNDVVIHSDTSFMPHSSRAWESWNWFSETVDMEKSNLVLTYQLNTLQPGPRNAPTVMETLNRDREPAEGTLLAHLVFDHPMYNGAALAAQARVPAIQGTGNVWYAGAWTRYGFHEDGILSGVRVAEALGATLPWGAELDETRTRMRPGARVPMLGQTRKLSDNELTPEVPLGLPRAAAVGDAGEQPA